MIDTPKPFVDFYNRVGFAPTRQSKGAGGSHRAHREFLYQSLGLPNISLRRSDIVEFGAGSGENADWILELGPRSFTFVDASEVVLRALQTRHASLACEVAHVSYELCDILEYESENKFDVVICEGVIPLQLEPRSMAGRVLECVRPDGVVVLTCMDSISAFSEIARRYIAHLLFDDMVYSEELVERLTRFFAPDFAALPGMSRRPTDWCLDSILNPWVGQFFSLEDAMNIARSDFALLGASPRMFQDWRWYKDPSVIKFEDGIDRAINSYQRNIQSMLDTRFVCEEAPKGSSNLQLVEATNHIAGRVRGAISFDVPYHAHEFGGDVEALVSHANSAHPDTIESLLSLVRWSQTGVEADLAAFRRLWGRGQQYISFVRNT